MTQTVIDILKSVGAVLTDDHFVYTSGKHGSVYINKDALYPHTQQTAQVGKLFAEQCKDMDIDTVAAPALGGIILSQWTAYYLSEMKGKEIAGVYAEKNPDKSFTFTRGYDQYIKGKKVLVIEDLTTTGGSVKKIADVVRAAGGNVVAVGVMVNRDPENVNSEMMEAPFFALGVLKAEAFDEAEMPADLAARPINTTVGHGKKYLEAKSMVK
jgi:orotate phosphoribosyltransferase